MRNKFDELGTIRSVFKPGIENIVAGIMIGILLVGAAIGSGYYMTMVVIDSEGDLPFSAERGWCWLAIGMLSCMCTVALIGGFLLLCWMWNLSALRVSVGELGFAVSSRGSSDIFMWDRIAHVQETHVYERPPVLKGVAKLMLPVVTSKSYSVVRDDDIAYDFDGNSTRKHTLLAGMIRTETDRRGVPWEIVEVHA